MNNKQGWIVIGTKLDNKQLEKDLASQKKELQQYEKEAETLLKEKTKAEADLEPYQREINALREQKKEIDNLSISEEQKQALVKRLEPLLQEINTKYKEQIDSYNEINQKINENAKNQGQLKQEIKETTSALAKAKNMNQISSDIKNVENSINNIGNSVGKVVKKVGRWAVAVFGIRSAYMAVRNAISVISQSDEQLKADIDYMKNAIAFTLEPVVRTIVNLAKELLIAIQSIVYSITGKNIFANANKGLDKANKSANALKKTLASFDEMNILGDSGSGTVAPSFDLTQESLFKNWNMSQFIEKGKEIAKNLAKGINEAFTKIDWAGLAQGISMAIIGILEIIATFIREIDWSLVGQSIATFILSVDWIGIATAIMNLLFEGLLAGMDLLSGIIDGILKKFEDPKFYEDLIESGTKIIEKLAEGMGKLDASMETVWSKIISFFLEKLGINDNDANKVGKDIGQGIADGIEDIATDTIFGPIFGNIIKIAKKVFDIASPSKEFKSIGENLIEGLKNGLSSSANKVIDFINSLIDKINSALSFRWNNITIGGVKLLDAGSLNVGRIPHIPRFAKGAVINQPGRGVPVGVGGERGQEGIVPLTDSQQMALLGEAIGKYITVNATVPVYVGNRLVLREMKRIEAEDNFAYNR